MLRCEKNAAAAPGAAGSPQRAGAAPGYPAACRAPQVATPHGESRCYPDKAAPTGGGFCMLADTPRLALRHSTAGRLGAGRMDAIIARRRVDRTDHQQGAEGRARQEVWQGRERHRIGQGSGCHPVLPHRRAHRAPQDPQEGPCHPPWPAPPRRSASSPPAVHQEGRHRGVPRPHQGTRHPRQHQLSLHDCGGAVPDRPSVAFPLAFASLGSARGEAVTGARW